MIPSANTNPSQSLFDAWSTSVTRSAASQQTNGSEVNTDQQVGSDEQEILNDLLSSSNGQPSLLAQLTNVSYSSTNPPDVLEVSTGSEVTPEFAGGYKSVGWVLNGADVTFFATGQSPDVVKGVAISYSQDASAASRQTTLQMAQSYLSDHLSDSQNAAGQWNQPTFDVKVH